MHPGLMHAPERRVVCCGVTSPTRAHREDGLSHLFVYLLFRCSERRQELLAAATSQNK